MDDFDYVPGFIPGPSTSTAAPKISEYDFPEQQEPKKRREPVKRPAPVSPVIQNIKAIAVAAVVCAVLFTMLSSIIYLNKMIVQNKKTISELSGEIKQAQAENIRLSAELGTIISAEKIRNYAVSELGMQKAERYQIYYFEDRDGDRVVIADGKQPNINT